MRRTAVITSLTISAALAAVGLGEARSADALNAAPAVAAAAVETSAASPDRVVLNPTATPHRSQTFTWRTDSAVRTAVVEIAPVDGGAPRRVTAQETTFGRGSSGAAHHTATVEGLDAATRYRYRVGHESSGWSPWYEFRTAGTAAEPWSFLYFGDAQNNLNDVWPDVTQRAYSRFPDAALSLHAGDLINNADSDDEWASWFAAQGDDVRTRNVIATPGNHEYKGDADLAEYRSHFGFPRNGPFTRNEDVWFTDYQGVRFISLNANVIVGLDQIIWMHQVLANNPNRWTVVTFHQPLFSGSTGRDNPGIRLAWQPIFEQYDVDLVLQGHDHVYARGHMAHREAPDGTHSGPVYVVAVGGGKYYDVAPPTDNIWTMAGATREVAAQQMSTYQVVGVERDRLTYRSIVGRLGAQPAPAGLEVGDTLDSVTISKDSSGRKVVTDEVPAIVADNPLPGTPFDPLKDLLDEVLGSVTK